MGLFAQGVNTKTASDEQYNEVVVFDAERDNPGVFENRSAPGADYTPQVKPSTTDDGKKCLEFSYIGTKGQARSSLQCGKMVQELVQSGIKIVGAKLIIDYDNDDHGNLNILSHTATGGFNLTQPLQKGTHEYIFLSGFGFPDRWIIKY